MRKVAVYGKGGIGKSTLSANLSFLLSVRGFSVLHVGCDPKADSTRLLMGGRRIPTYASTGDAAPRTGCNGISCIECGGASPGTGCAGRGMSLLFDEISGIEADYRVCDVLGDVVCGGFSLPIREGNADEIVLVTSEEFMSIYAANMILRGIRNINDAPVILGLVLNRRGDEGTDMVRAFSDAVGPPIIAEIPRSGLFAEADSSGTVLCEAFPDSVEAGILRSICDSVASPSRLYRPMPLSDESMRKLAAGITEGLETDVPKSQQCSFESYDPERNITYRGAFVMPSCTSHGAVDAALRIADAATILHGPRNCANLMEFVFLRRSNLTLRERGNRTYPANMYSTGMDAVKAFRGDEVCI
ncbi:MAG: hypothetical protein IJ856_02395, partial [Candidatus Methanomethylophilaceae archaeon]|nr:hypothetical protein [Candidatus Methanomethylophilaceae archaeon]